MLLFNFLKAILEKETKPRVGLMLFFKMRATAAVSYTPRKDKIATKVGTKNT